MARVNLPSALRIIATNNFWYRSKTPASDCPPTMLARSSTPSLPPRNTVPGWGFVSAKPLLRLTEAGSGPRTTILAERFSISHWQSLRTPENWMPGATDDLLRDDPTDPFLDFCPVTPLYPVGRL